MIEDNFERLIDALSASPLSIDVLQKITYIIERNTSDLIASFTSQSLLTLNQWSWRQFSDDSHQWIDQPKYITFFQTLASFNKSLIFNYDNIEVDLKATLLIPDSIDSIDSIFKQIERSQDDNDPFIRLVSLWFDNLSYFIQENPQFNTLPNVRYINEYIGQNYLITNQYKFYLIQLQQPRLSHSIFTSKQLFYVKTCSFSAHSYLSAKAQNFIFTSEQILQHVGTEFLQIINNHSHTIESWDKKLIICIAHLTGFMLACCWWSKDKLTQENTLFSSEQSTCDFVQSLIRILSYEAFYQEIQVERANGETMLIDAILKFLLHILGTQNLHWFFRTQLSLSDTLFKIAELSPFCPISLCAYAVLGEILTDEKLKELTIADNVGKFFFKILEQGWLHPSQKYKQLPVHYLLRNFTILSKSDVIQQSVVNSKKLSLFIDMSDRYPIAFDIIWTLSFNQNIQGQLRSNPSFISKISHLAKECDDEQMRKTMDGILWNLQVNHQDHPIAENTNEQSFDIMISYSHKDKVLCKQLYDELIKAGFRVWIDFDQMHGNVMDAMAQAIERSQTIIICMSEQYRRSNYCRAEAHYAFQRERKIVPVLMQKHYKADGWLLFLTGHLLYVDFTKYEFGRAMELLFKELRTTDIVETKTNIVTSIILPMPSSELCLPPRLPKNITDWSSIHVQQWLTGHNLIQLSHLLADFDGRNVLDLGDFIINGDIKQILHLLQEDSNRKTGQTLSLIELSRFRSLIANFVKTNHSTTQKRTFVCCRMM